MFSAKRLTVVFAGVLLVAWLWNTASGGINSATGVSSDFVNVELELVDGSKALGTFLLKSIPVESPYGAMDLDVTKIKTLDVSLPESPDKPAVASVTMVDKFHVSGSLLVDAFSYKDPEGNLVSVQAKDVMRLAFKHPRDTSLVSVIIGLITLTLMEVVLGVDNVIFLAILTGKLPEEQRPRARWIGLGAALGTRLLLLMTLSFLLGLTKPVFTLPAMPFFESLEARGISWRDMLLLAGGLFLIGKSTFEMHEKLEHAKTADDQKPAGRSSFLKVIVMIAIVDIVFSLDSVITAVGMVDDVFVMVTAMVIAMLVMLAFAGPISRFVDNRPTVKILALSFLILIGVLLVAEGLGQHLDKGYIYFAMAFAVGVELVNIQLRGKPMM